MNFGPWVELYRPSTITDCILPDDIIKKFKKFAKHPETMTNLLLTGDPGVGKTTIALALMNDINADYIFINASKERNIDVLRTKIQNFATTVSFSGGRKFVILDEADFLNANSTMPALRAFTEEYSSNCGFIMTCNFEYKILEALRSRFAKIDFNIKKSDYKDMITKALARFCDILTKENVEFDKKVLVQHIMNFYPDLRKALNELQAYSNISGKIDTGILSISNGGEIDELIEILKSKNFTNMRKWVADNDVNMENLIENLYRKGSKIFDKEKLPYLIMHLAAYDYKSAFVMNKEINAVAMLAEIMRDCC